MAMSATYGLMRGFATAPAALANYPYFLFFFFLLISLFLNKKKNTYIFE